MTFRATGSPKSDATRTASALLDTISSGVTGMSYADSNSLAWDSSITACFKAGIFSVSADRLSAPDSGDSVASSGSRFEYAASTPRAWIARPGSVYVGSPATWNCSIQSVDSNANGLLLWRYSSMIASFIAPGMAHVTVVNTSTASDSKTSWRTG